MKKFLLGAAVVGLALASCVKNEANLDGLAGQKITFDSPVMYANEDTRANVYGEIGDQAGGGGVTYTYPSNENFVIYAVSHEGDFAGWASATPAIFNGEAISYDNNVDGWAPKTSTGGYYYWENGKKMSFSACSPADLEQKTECVRSYGATGLSIENFEIASDASKQYDLMFAKRAVNKTSADMSHSANYYSGLPIVFQHALTSVRFSVANTAPETVILTEIKVKGVKYKGTFNENIDETDNNVALYDRTPTTGNVNPAWTVKNDIIENPYTAFNGSVQFLESPRYVSQIVSESGNSGICNQLLLMPQELTESAEVEVHYTVNGSANTKIVPLKGLFTTKKVNNQEQQGEAIEKWEMGKRYTYRLFYSSATADKDKIYFAPSSEGWEDVDVIVVPL